MLLTRRSLRRQRSHLLLCTLLQEAAFVVGRALLLYAIAAYFAIFVVFTNWPSSWGLRGRALLFAITVFSPIFLVLIT